MTAIRITRFLGEATGVTPRMIPDGFAQKMLDADVRKGTLRPVRGFLPDAQSVAMTDPATIYRYVSGHWLAFAGDVDVVRSPLADDAWERIYWTGDGVPKMASVTNATAGVAPYPNAYYELGVPAPTVIPSVAASGGQEPDTSVRTVYAYSYVTEYEEEGPLSLPSAEVVRWDADEAGNGWVDVTIPPIAATGRNITKVRIYRSESGGEWFYVTDVLAGTGVYRDAIKTQALGIAAISIDWDPPNPAMIGLTRMPGGFMAGFFGNVLCFSEPGYPHAWPLSYRLTFDDDIVGIAVSATGLVVCTTGQPVLVVGATPSAMDAVKIEARQACVSKRSIVDMGDFVVYASPDGLVAIGGNSAQMMTEELLERDAWQALNPASIHACREGDRYLAFYDNGTQACFAFSKRGFEPMTGWASAAYYAAQEDVLYLAQGASLMRFDAGAVKPFAFRTGIYEVQQGTSLSCGKIIAANYPITLTAFADGVQVYSFPVTSNQMFRLPAGFARVREWEFSLSGSHEVFSLQLAGAPVELV